MDKFPRIGVSIATFNNCAVLQETLKTVFDSKYPDLHVCVVDSGSTDGTHDMLESKYGAKKNFELLFADANVWWTAGTNMAIKSCLQKDCSYILLLNPDSQIEEDTITNLLAVTQDSENIIAASLVVRKDDSSRIWWAGNSWGRLWPLLPIWSSRYLIKKDTCLSEIPQIPYRTSEVHGRGVLVPSSVFKRIGLYDEVNLPHYGADVEFSRRAQANEIAMLVVPNARVLLATENSGMTRQMTFRKAFRGYWNFLTKRKNGEMLHVGWHILSRYVPYYAVFPSYLFLLALNTARFWRQVIRDY